MEHIAINSKRLAKALKVPVIALCQLNRGVEGRDDKRATLADLKQAGAIEENADVVGFLFRESYYMERAEPKQKADETLDQFDGRHALWKAALARVQDKIEITLAKNRNGACATVYLRFDGSTSRIWQEGDGSE
jgi:replicative DNA helicase